MIVLLVIWYISKLPWPNKLPELKVDFDWKFEFRSNVNEEVESFVGDKSLFPLLLLLLLILDDDGGELLFENTLILAELNLKIVKWSLFNSDIVGGEEIEIDEDDIFEDNFGIEFLWFTEFIEVTLEHEKLLFVIKELFDCILCFDIWCFTELLLGVDCCDCECCDCDCSCCCCWWWCCGFDCNCFGVDSCGSTFWEGFVNFLVLLISFFLLLDEDWVFEEGTSFLEPEIIIFFKEFENFEDEEDEEADKGEEVGDRGMFVFEVVFNFVLVLVFELVFVFVFILDSYFLTKWPTGVVTLWVWVWVVLLLLILRIFGIVICLFRTGKCTEGDEVVEGWWWWFILLACEEISWISELLFNTEFIIDIGINANTNININWIERN